MPLLLTERHIKDMKHCIVMDQKQPYKRHEKLFYRPWRNYYATGPECEGCIFKGAECIECDRMAFRWAWYYFCLEMPILKKLVKVPQPCLCREE